MNYTNTINMYISARNELHKYNQYIYIFQLGVILQNDSPQSNKEIL